MSTLLSDEHLTQLESRLGYIEQLIHEIERAPKSDSDNPRNQSAENILLNKLTKDQLLIEAECDVLHRYLRE